MSARHWRQAIPPRATWIVFAVTAAIYLATLGSVVCVDAYSASLAAWRLAETGAPWFDGFVLPPGIDPDSLFISENPDGHLVAHRSPGVVLAGLPAYLLAQLGAAHSDFDLRPASVVAALMTATTVALLLSHARRRVPLPIAAAAALTFALATPMWSVSADAMWTHSLTTLAIVGIFWSADRDRWWLVGLFGVLGLWGRPHLALVVAIVGLGVAYSRRRPSIAVKIGLVSGMGLLLASLWTQWMYQSWLPTGGYQVSAVLEVSGARDLRGSLLNQAGVWISPYTGVLVWTPVLLVLAPAMVRSARSAPDYARWLALAGLLYTALQVHLLDFTGGDAFYGYRLGLEVLACLLPLAVHSLQHLAPLGRRLLAPVIAAQFFVVALGSLFGDLMNVLDDPWRDNAFADAANRSPLLWCALILAAILGVLVARVWPPTWQLPPPSEMSAHTLPQRAAPPPASGS